MRALDTIANSIRLGYIHPTVMLNTLIEAENGGGLREVRRIERHLDRGVRALQQRQHPHAEIAEKWAAEHAKNPIDPSPWGYPDEWLEDGQQFQVGERTLQAVATPGHTLGHFVFTDLAGGFLFSGDHVLPTITPSIGFEGADPVQPLGDFMASLARVRELPDLRLLPAHGPVGMSSHTRVDQLLEHHEHRLQLCLEPFSGDSPRTALDVAASLPWTRHERTFASLDLFNSALATMETRAHLLLLVARGALTSSIEEDVEIYRLP